MYYYRDLTEFKHTLGFLVGTMQSAQDVYEAWIKYFDEDLLEGLNGLSGNLVGVSINHSKSV